MQTTLIKGNLNDPLPYDGIAYGLDADFSFSSESMMNEKTPSYLHHQSPVF